MNIKTGYKSFIRKIALLLAAAMMSAIIIPVAACKNPDKNTDPGTIDTPTDATYTVTVCSMGGTPLGDVSVELYSGGEKVASRKTGNNGAADFKVEKGDYDVRFKDLPAGYTTSGRKYSLTSAQSNVTFNIPSQVITDVAAPEKTRYRAGDVMYDFTVTTPALTGFKKITLSELINTSEKKAVLLNFWGSGCPNCADEFPVMELAYQKYKDKLSIIALDHENFYGDKEDAVVQWQSRYNLTFDMAMDTADVAIHFGVNRFPTSIMIDRYGVICDITVGAVTEELKWTQLFEKFTSDDYTQSVSNPGTSVDDSIDYIPDKPADFGKVQSPSSDINALISPALNAKYTPETDENWWPWEIQGDCIVPTNAGAEHHLTIAAVTATFSAEANKVFTFDYMCRSDEGDTLQVVVYNTTDGMGKQVFADSGEQTDFRTKRFYVTLSPGAYSVTFVYYKDFSADKGEDCVYIKNLRVEDIDALGGEPLEIAYFAAREYNALTGEYNTHDEYELQEDGYYHVLGHKNSDGTDPYLMADFQNYTPYSRKDTIYREYIQSNNAVFGGVNYYKQLAKFNSVAGNSEKKGLIPVDVELQKVLDAIAKDQTGSNYDKDLWTEFCSYYIHYGSGKSFDNPIKGLYYKAAHEYDVTKENVVEYDRLLTPRGIVYKYTPSESGAYLIQSTFTPADAANKLGAIAWFYRESDVIAAGHHNDARATDYSGEDQFIREGGEYNFHIYQYLNAGETYYIVIAPDNMDTVTNIPFEITRLGASYEVLTVAAAGYYTQTEDNKIILPTYCTPVLKDGLYYTANGEGIYVDFTKQSRMFDQFTIEELLFDYFYSEVRIVVNEKDEIVYGDDGKPLTMEVTAHYSDEQPLNNGAPTVDLPHRERSYPFEFTIYERDKDGKVISSRFCSYTDTFKKYYAMRDTNEESMTCGMVQIDEELKKAIEDFYHYQSGSKYGEEWLKACYFKQLIKAPD